MGIILSFFLRYPEQLDPYMDLIMDENLAKNEWPAAKMDKYKREAHQSLMVKNLSREQFERLKNIKTPTAQWTLARAINTGVMHPSSFVGIHAGDVESYQVFKEIFYPIIEQYHVGYKIGQSHHTTDLNPSHLKGELSVEAKKLIISSRIRVARNLCGFPLNPGGSKASRLQIESLMASVLSRLPTQLAGEYFSHAKMSPEKEKMLIDSHFLFKGRDAKQAASGYHQYWPFGRGIFLSFDRKFLVWVNEGDHLRLISMQNDSNLLEVFSRLATAINQVEVSLRQVTNAKDDVFMTDSQLGTITCCPSNLGGGMRASVHISIPNLIKSWGFEKIDKVARDLQCQARGTYGEHTEVIDRVDLSNWRRLGFSEAQLVSDVIAAANFFAAEEFRLAKAQPEP